MNRLIYKVLTRQQWLAAQAGAAVEAPVDQQDGYVHFSTKDTLEGTLAKWFRGQADCVLLEYDANDFGSELRWEPSRDDLLFPHVYGTVSAAAALRHWTLGLAADGVPCVPSDL